MSVFDTVAVGKEIVLYYLTSLRKIGNETLRNLTALSESLGPDILAFYLLASTVSLPMLLQIAPGRRATQVYRSLVRLKELPKIGS